MLLNNYSIIHDSFWEDEFRQRLLTFDDNSEKNMDDNERDDC